jgi:hypothetical protein
MRKDAEPEEESKIDPTVSRVSHFVGIGRVNVKDRRKRAQVRVCMCVVCVRVRTRAVNYCGIPAPA